MEDHELEAYSYIAEGIHIQIKNYKGNLFSKTNLLFLRPRF